MLPIIFIVPVIQLLLLSFAVDYEIKEIKLFVVDMDQSEVSNKMIRRFTSSGYFVLSGNSFQEEDAEHALEERKADLSIVIPSGFEENLFKQKKEDIQLLIDAVDGSKASIAGGYAATILMDYQKDLIKENGFLLSSGVPIQFNSVELANSLWYNPYLNYKAYMVPGILVVLVTMIGGFLSSMNIVREKELGTIEQINVTPIKKYHFILGKTLPFLLIGLIELTLGLIVSKVVFNVPFVGNVFHLYFFAILYLFLILGFGLLISTMTNTQQQAMFITWFFMVIFILMGGLFTPIENMPLWAQKITLANPIRYFIEVTRMIMLKGSGLSDMVSHFLIILFYAILMNTMAVLRYRKQT